MSRRVESTTAAARPKFTEAKRRHDEAMARAHEARLLPPDAEEARAAYAAAFRLEVMALESWTATTGGAEPTRSILCRSVAALALAADDLDESATYAELALDDTAQEWPPWIRPEVTEIQDAIEEKRRMATYVAAIAQGEAAAAVTTRVYGRAPYKGDGQGRAQVARAEHEIANRVFMTVHPRAGEFVIEEVALRVADSAVSRDHKEVVRRYKFVEDIAQV